MTTTDMGQDARQPRELPARAWKDIFMRAFGEVGKDNVGLVAAGVAFYGFLAIFPAISAIVGRMISSRARSAMSSVSTGAGE